MTDERRKPASHQAGAPGQTRRRKAHAVERVPRWFVPTMLIVFGLGALVATMVVIESRRTSPPPMPAPMRPHHELMTMHRVAGELIGGYLAESHSRDHILLLMPPLTRRSAEDDVVLEGIQSIVTEDVALLTVATPDDDVDAPPAMWLMPGAFDKAIAAHPATDVVVSIAGLPVKPERMQFWRWRQRPDLVLFNASPLRLEHLIEDGAIDAILIRRPGKAQEPALRAADDPRNWLMITTENFDQVTIEFPHLFSYSP